ncbi:MAG: hypothetical protein ACI8RD_000156 [Bacillariaceae sp.]|jgi:hypothetical protein
MSIHPIHLYNMTTHYMPPACELEKYKRRLQSNQQDYITPMMMAVLIDLSPLID